jgi:hypothetical protein
MQKWFQMPLFGAIFFGTLRQQNLPIRSKREKKEYEHFVRTPFDFVSDKSYFMEVTPLSRFVFL